VRTRREDPERFSALHLGVDSRHQPALVSSSDTITRHTVPDLLPGTLDLLILRTLQTQSLHGWAISERIKQISQDVLRINQGSLYPALHRLEHQGWIEAEWGRLGAGPAAQVLSAYASRSPATCGGSRRVGAHVHSHRPCDEAGVTA
jgi:DNA-binding HxlR family transcriptional regulator